MSFLGMDVEMIDSSVESGRCADAEDLSRGEAALSARLI